MSTRMSRAERESFLTGTHIGVLSVAGSGGRPPMAVPIWYGYEPGGELTFATSPDSVKMALIRAAGQIGFTVQQEAMPYKYVSIEGSVVGYERTDADEYRRWSVRYLGPDAGERFFDSIEDHVRTMITVRVRPERWRTYDFGREFRG
ncbi:pyridoxamine 5'-phosphate oxidase [Nonomuraea phyllanthi]|uniref:pyridoxamine 5'-phosphate oxidase family protein n=1 Tax=Nonomuraea phyllanthi TaxID=2219224 RepID=UPI001293A584|nr:pyridoxamine 5'-phosphate oxidase family protein [Nonomuraea phyllanthi]QFY10328.1 pyridoxamine 5'-phosphate oxidase [Nonomuraea phyllanthi]